MKFRLIFSTVLLLLVAIATLLVPNGGIAHGQTAIRFQTSTAQDDRDCEGPHDGVLYPDSLYSEPQLLDPIDWNDPTYFELLGNDSYGYQQCLESYVRYADSTWYTLVMQKDGNLVIYKHIQYLYPQYAIWSTGTWGSGATYAVMQDDGNFVVYSPTRAVWASNSQYGCTNCQLVMQNDGNLVIYNRETGRATWASGTDGH